MAGRILRELRQKRPIGPEEEAFLNVLRTAEALSQRLTELLRPHELSPTQYNVLRILRGAGEAGLPCGEIAARMITRDPDVTRLVDRLGKRGLATRARDAGDRRVVTIRITPEGRTICDLLDEPIARLHEEQLGRIGRKRLEALVELLEEARGPEE